MRGKRGKMGLKLGTFEGEWMGNLVAGKVDLEGGKGEMGKWEGKDGEWERWKNDG